MKRLYSIFAIVVLAVLAVGFFGAVRGDAAGSVVRWPGVFANIFASRTMSALNPPPIALSPVPMTFVVDSTGDAPDATINGVCLTAGGVCTLRAAIQEANATPDVDTINFTIPTVTDVGCVVGTGVCTISPATALPTITQPVTIDGYTQPTSTPNTLAVGDDADINIELNGTSAGALADGLNITAGSCTVRGLAIYRFLGDGIELGTAGGNIIAGNFIGTDATGAGTTNGNPHDGVLISNVGTNTIGGSTPQARNVISANGEQGVEISGTSATGNIVQGNYIGTDRTGTVDVGNAANGVFVGGPSNTVGGSTATPGQGVGNVISGNQSAGVRITTLGNTNSVAGNLIGLAAGGATALGNAATGVFLSNTASTNTIGGTTADLRNIISSNGLGVRMDGAGTTGNLLQGNYIGTNAAGTADLGNGGDGVFITSGATGNTIGGLTATPGTAAGNVISGNGSDGIEFNNSTSAGTNNTVQGNLIGTSASGLVVMRNDQNGVQFFSSSNMLIGGSTATARNVIAGGPDGPDDGVDISGATSVGNTIAGNYIGTDITGTADFGAGGDGVNINNGAVTNTIGGLTATPGTAPGNVIAGNNSDGVEINTGTAGPPNNTVQGNLIGTNASGTTLLRNDSNGVVIISSANNLIGGSTATARNVITGGGGVNDDGVDIQGATSAGNTVAGNYIGTDINGTADFGAGEDGVRITTSGDNNIIGGSAATPGTAPGNIISGNTGDGVEITGNGTTGNLVRGNLIGLQVNGTTALANGENGVLISSAAASNTVGGTTAGLANTIAFNGGAGVFVSGGANNAIRRNSIHSNTGLGIDLGTTGVTPNDTDDPDTGPNNLQNFPVITDARTGSTIIMGSLNSTPSTTFTIEFFSNVTPDPTAYGEGQTYLDSITVTTDAGGDVSFTHTAATTATVGHVISATATDPTGNTSEFSNTRQVLAPTLARVREFRATRYGDGTVVDWSTEREVDNLGFHLYRQDEGRRVLVTPSLVAGSALTVGPGNRLTAGYSYSWFDPQGTPGSVYSLEAIDLNGSRDWAGPVSSYAAPNGGNPRRSPKRERSMLLNEIAADGRAQSGVSSWPCLACGRSIPLSSAGTVNSPVLEKAEQGGEQPQIKRHQAAAENQSVGPPHSKAEQQSLITQQAIAAGRAVKIQVRKSGWYRVTQAELVAAGFDPLSDARSLQLYADGEEVPISLSNEGARLGANDTLEFYGVALDTPTADTRVYWLVSGNSTGKRMAARRGKLKPADPNSDIVSGSFDLTTERRDRVLYFSNLINGDAENIFGPPVRPEPVTQTLVLRNLARDSASQPRLEVALQGLTTGAHTVQLEVNGTNVGTMTFANREHATAKFSVSTTLLREGDNAVSLTSLNGQLDISLIDWVRLTYPHQYKADNNTLGFSAWGSQPVKLEGFSRPNVRVVDVTDPNSPTQLSAYATSSGGAYNITLQPAGAGVRSLIAFTEDQIGHPVSITANQPSSWNAATNGADMVIITHQDFRQAIEPLASLRRSQGLSVAVVDVEDVYDEFSYGAHTPAAIKSFLMSAAANWSRKPQYLLLVGDSSWDPRNYLNGSENDYVPTKLIDTLTMETGSDDWLADFNGLGLANLAVGRLPAGTVAEANLMVSKILSYEQERELNAPLRGALMVADSGFESQSNQTRELLPSNVTATSLNRADVGNDDAMRGQIVDALNQGPMIVNYYGHGSVRVWTGAGLLSSDMAGTLTNTNRLSVFVMMTCLNGYSSDVNFDSLGEAALKAPSGGAVAVWASSGFTVAPPQFEMNTEFYRLLFGGQPIRLGDATRNAKAATSDLDVRRTWILLGDPAMRVR